MSYQSCPFLLDGRSLALPSVGVGVYTSRLIRGLLRYATDLNFKVLVSDHLNVQELEGSLGLSSEHIIPIPSRYHIENSYLDSILEQIELSCFLRRHYPEALFHATNLFWSPFMPARTIITLHDVIPHRFPRYFGKYPIRKFMQKRYERFAASSLKLLAVSYCTARDAVELTKIPSEKISVLYNWVGEEFLSFPRDTQASQIATLRIKHHLPSVFWLYLGGYDYRKNIEFLIHSYAKAKSSYQGTLPPLVLAGTIPTDLRKPYCNVLGAIQESSLTSEEILMPGRIDSDDLPALYAAASLLVYPSLYEGFGYPPAEAMALGTPVIVSDSSSLPEVVRRSECRFNPTNAEELSQKLLAAANDSTQFLCPLPREFTEQEAIRRYMNIIGQILQSHHNAREQM